MLFEAKTKDGENWVRKTVLDMIGIPEDQRNPVGVPISPAEKVALLHQSSPVFRQWLGEKYRHTFRNPQRAPGVVKDWEQQKLLAWKQILERIPSEHPEFYQARGHSWAQAVRKAGAVGTTMAEAGNVLQNEFLSYISANPEQKGAILSKKDPETPKPFKVAAGLLEKGWASTKDGATGPLLRESFEKKNTTKGSH